MKKRFLPYGCHQTKLRPASVRAVMDGVGVIKVKHWILRSVISEIVNPYERVLPHISRILQI